VLSLTDRRIENRPRPSHHQPIYTPQNRPLPAEAAASHSTLPPRRCMPTAPPASHRGPPSPPPTLQGNGKGTQVSLGTSSCLFQLLPGLALIRLHDVYLIRVLLTSSYRCREHIIVVMSKDNGSFHCFLISRWWRRRRGRGRGRRFTPYPQNMSNSSIINHFTVADKGL